MSFTNACCNLCQLRAPQSSCRTSWRAQLSSAASQRYTYAVTSAFCFLFPSKCTVCWQRRRLTPAAGSRSAYLQNRNGMSLLPMLEIGRDTQPQWACCCAVQGGGGGEGAAGRPAIKALCRRRRGRRILQVRQRKCNPEHVRYRPTMNRGQRPLHTAGLAGSYIGRLTAVDGTSTPICSS